MKPLNKAGEGLQTIQAVQHLLKVDDMKEKIENAKTLVCGGSVFLSCFEAQCGRCGG